MSLPTMPEIPDHIRKQFEEAQAAYLRAQRMAEAHVEPERSKYETVSEWVRWWWLYLKENEHFTAYCRARREGDTTTCSKLERDYTKIAELYDDWHDIDVIDKYGMSKSAWKTWFDDHRDLFLEREPEVRLVSLPNVQSVAGHLLVQIPQGLTKDEVLELVAKFVDQSYDTTTPRVAIPPPKYSLYAPKGRLDKSTFQAVSKAYWLNCALDTYHGGTRSLSEVALYIIDNETDMGFDWKLVDIDHGRRRNGSFTMAALDQFKPQVIRYKKHYAAYVANTIDGIFPKKEPREVAENGQSKG